MTVSYDAGATWSTNVLSAPGSGYSTICYGMTASKADGAVYACGYDYDRATYTYNPWVKRTDDGGATVTDVSGDLAAVGVNYSTAIWASPSDADHLVVGTYASTGVSIHVTTDGGTTWVPATTGPANRAYQFAYNPGTGMLYGANCTAGVWESADGGMNWTDTGLGTADTHYVGIDKKNGYLFAGTYSAGVQRMAVATDYLLDVKCNGGDSGVVVDAADNAFTTINVSAGPLLGTGHDVWVLVKTAAGGKYSFGTDGRFHYGFCTEYLTGPLSDICDIVVDGTIPVGGYNVYLGLDSMPNGNLNIPYVVDYDMVDITVVP